MTILRSLMSVAGRALIRAAIGASLLKPLAAETFTMRDGSVITGDLKSLAVGVYDVQTAYGLVKLPATSVLAISQMQARSAGAAAAPAAVPILRFAGSTTIGDELMPALIEAYASGQHLTNMQWTPEGDASEQHFMANTAGGLFLKAHLSRHGSATAFSALAQGTAEIGMASRPIKAEEKSNLAAAGFGEADAPGQEHVLALDGLVVLVNRANPLDRLSLADLAAIFSGRTTDWKAVGGQPGLIHLFGRDDKSGTADTFAGLVLKGEKMAATAQLMDSSDSLSDKIASDPSAIGFAGFAYVRRTKALSIVAECGLETAPSDFFVRTEEYPLSRRLFLYTKAPTAAGTEPAQAFVNFALGPMGQIVVGRGGFVDLLPHLAGPDYGAGRIAVALAQVAKSGGDASFDLRQIQAFNRIASGRQRVSVTYRFRTASFDLDTRGMRDIDRLVQALAAPEMAHRDLMIVGFSDAQGSPVRNVALAQARADRVASLLRAKGVTPKLVTGLGRVAPVACNSSPDGLLKNRRVEIWLSKP